MHQRIYYRLLGLLAVLSQGCSGEILFRYATCHPRAQYGKDLR